MILIVLAAAAVIAIALYQVLQEIFSALIMAVLTTLCAALAFHYYEPLAALLYENQPAHADAAALIALFVIPLLVLRVLLDKFLPHTVVVGMWANRIGAALLGLWAGIVMIGVLTVALQMLPLGAKVMTFLPYDASLQRNQRLAPFYPDELTVGMVGMLSRGVLSGDRSYERAHDDLLLELFCARNTAGKRGRVDAYPDALTVDSAHLPPEDLPCLLDLRDEPAPERTKLLVVRVAVSDATREETSSGQATNWWLLPATQFRLVAPSGRSYYPVGYLYAEPSRLGRPDAWNVTLAAGGGRAPREIANLLVGRPLEVGRQPKPDPTRPPDPDAKELVVDWLYRVRADEELQPDQAGEGGAYLIFRRNAKARLGKVAPDSMPSESQALKPHPGGR